MLAGAWRQEVYAGGCLARAAGVGAKQRGGQRVGSKVILQPKKCSGPKNQTGVG